MSVHSIVQNQLDIKSSVLLLGWSQISNMTFCACELIPPRKKLN